MKLLAVDTALGACSVALLQDAEILAHRFESMERGHAETLAPMVADAMGGHAYDSLDRLAVTVGPGTFTGQRVGLAFMRGLRLALDRPLIGITTLEALAAAAASLTGSRRVCAIHDARRGDAYLLLQDGDAVPSERFQEKCVAVFRPEPRQNKNLENSRDSTKRANALMPAILPFHEAIERIRAFGPCALAGTGAPAAAAALGEGFVPSGLSQPDAAWVGRLARHRPVPQDVPGPLYLRAPDAKLPGGALPA